MGDESDDQKIKSQPHIAIVIVEPPINDDHTITKPQSQIVIKRSLSLTPILTSLHAGYFRITLSLCSQALLWKTLGESPPSDAHAIRRLFLLLPSTAFAILWSITLFTLALFSLLYILRCLLYFHRVKSEFLHYVGVNYLFAPFISWLLLLQSSPFIAPESTYYSVLWWVFVVPVIILDVKIYGQWFTKGKRFVAAVANPTSQISVIGNLVAASAAAQMRWRETAICMFSIGMAHYLVLFVTLYQRLAGNASNNLPAMLMPVFSLFIAVPSIASLAWDAISGTFDNVSKMLFFLSLFLFMSLVSRPTLFRKAMRKFSLAWWAYSFPLTVLALASAEYAQEVKGGVAHAMMLVLSVLSVLVALALMAFTAFNTNVFLLDSDPKP
ncbi:hypothetical protein Q3G72_011593 [Acer saccharum]|nr:hypothetical protein Q3G72_011593 [Acer saccharum]